MTKAFESLILGTVLAVGVPLLIVAAGCYGFWHIRRDLRREK